MPLCQQTVVSRSTHHNAFGSGPWRAVSSRIGQGSIARSQQQQQPRIVAEADRGQQPQQCQATTTSRRDLLATTSVVAASTLLLLGSPGPALAGLDRYVKKKKLDPLETYVPLVLEARGVLQQLGDLVVKDPGTARALLRAGPFNGLRDNIRALGQYATLPAAEGGSGLSEGDASALVQAFFRALEDYDLLLYNAVREYKQAVQKADKGRSKQAKGDDDEDDDDADAAAAAAAAVAVDPAVGLDKAAAADKLQLAVQQLDKLISTVPADVLDKAEKVLAKVKGTTQAAL